MKHCKKPFFLGILCLIGSWIWALPGIVDVVPTTSGQYVYYKDYRFEEESYIGFLQYSETTFAARYISPKADGKNHEVISYFTIDDKAPHIVLTGEKVISHNPDDYVIVNYLHDILYEFTARRQKIALSNQNSSIQDYQNYEQMGGNVYLTFNSLIPIFNVEKIVSPEGNPIFQVVCINALQSSVDTSFTDFVGFPQFPQDFTYPVQNKKNLSRKKVQQIDNQWQKLAENFFILDNNAVFLQTSLPFAQNTENLSQVLTRYVLFSAQDTYLYFPKTKIFNHKDKIIIYNPQYSYQDKRWILDIKVLTTHKTETELQRLTVNEDFWKKNTAYFKQYLQNLIEEK